MSATIPTTRATRCGRSPLAAMVSSRPSAGPWKSRRAAVSFRTTDSGPVASRVSRPRPSTSRAPSASNTSGPLALVETACFTPSATTVRLDCTPLIRGFSTIDAARTPGTSRTAARIRSYTGIATVPSGWIGTSTRKVTRDSGRNPRSTRVRLCSVRSNSPAPVSSGNEIAICTASSARPEALTRRRRASRTGRQRRVHTAAR